MASSSNPDHGTSDSNFGDNLDMTFSPLDDPRFLDIVNTRDPPQSLQEVPLQEEQVESDEHINVMPDKSIQAEFLLKLDPILPHHLLNLCSMTRVLDEGVLSEGEIVTSLCFVLWFYVVYILVYYISEDDFASLLLMLSIHLCFSFGVILCVLISKSMLRSWPTFFI